MPFSYDTYKQNKQINPKQSKETLHQQKNPKLNHQIQNYKKTQKLKQTGFCFDAKYSMKFWKTQNINSSFTFSFHWALDLLLLSDVCTALFHYHAEEKVVPVAPFNYIFFFVSLILQLKNIMKNILLPQ